MENQERIVALARQAAEGNSQAFNELYLLTRDRAYFVAVSIAKNEEDALDILQESYLKAWQHMDDFRPPWEFTAWFRRITANTAKNYIRQRKPYLFSPDGGEELDPLLLQEEKDREYIPDAAMDTAETRRLIMGIVDNLPEDQRLCVLMYYYDDLPLADIAAVLDIPEGTVKKRLYLARKKISDGVENLEKNQGTKLYGAAPIPLLIWLLKGAAVESSKILPPMILGGTATAGAATGGIAAGIALPKVIAGIAAVAVIGGGTAAGITWAKRQNPVIAEPIPVTATQVQAAAEPFAFSLPALPGMPTQTAPPIANATASTQPTYMNMPTTQAVSQTTTAKNDATAAVTTAQTNTTTVTTAASTTTTTTMATTATTRATTTMVSAIRPGPITFESYAFDSVNDALAFGRIYSQCSIHIYFGAFDAFENDEGGVKANLLYDELRSCMEPGGGRINMGQLYAEYQRGNLLAFAKGLFTQYNQIYAKHLTPAELARFNSEVKPRLARLANAVSYLGFLTDSDAFNLAPYGSFAEIAALPGFPAYRDDSDENTIQSITAIWAFVNAHINASLPAIPSGNPADPGR